MRLERLIPFWLFLLAGGSLLLWSLFAPPGYLFYSYQWLKHIPYEEIWTSEQRSVSDRLVLPSLAAWAEKLNSNEVVSRELYLHDAGTPTSNREWAALESQYRERGIDIIDKPTSSKDINDAAAARVEEFFGQRPFALKQLFLDVNARFKNCEPSLCRHRPAAAWVYVYSKNGVRIYWPGSNQATRYAQGHSPSLAYNNDPSDWLGEMLKHESWFEPLGGDSLGFGDLMTTTYRIDVGGVPAIVAADTYWEEAPVRTIRLGAIAYTAWGVASAVAVLVELVLILFALLATRREGNGVCVTVDIVGWSKIDDVQERFLRQRALDSSLKRAFFASTGQRLVRLPTGDGYHVLFLDHWGANIYREALPFASELLVRWDARVKPTEGMKGATLRISIGSHGSARIRRKDGDWIVIGDRIVSAVRIDEVSKTTKTAEHHHWTIAVEQSFKNEARLAAKVGYDVIVEKESGPFVERDKAGKEHTFSLLTLKPRLAGSPETSAPGLAGVLTAFANRLFSRRQPV